MKYEALKAHIRTLATDEWRARFSEIEKILGFRLPTSARRHTAWWANSIGTHSHAGAWLENSWVTTEVDLTREALVFRREKAGQKYKGVLVQHKASGIDPTQSIPWQWDQTEKLAGTLQLSWQPLGRITLQGTRLKFPPVSAEPGLYRFRLKSGRVERRYVGESANIRRRFHSNYASPSKGQQTSWRINKALVEALANGAEISVAIATSEFALTTGGKKRSVDLSNKAMRRMFEHFAQVYEGDLEIESLNR